MDPLLLSVALSEVNGMKERQDSRQQQQHELDRLLFAGEGDQDEQDQDEEGDDEDEGEGDAEEDDSMSLLSVPPACASGARTAPAHPGGAPRPLPPPPPAPRAPAAAPGSVKVKSESADEQSRTLAAAAARKRKKAARACNHCQTAHLTCDDNRPCERCLKRNLGDTCQDGQRKKAKYLRDIEDEVVNAGKIHPTPFTKERDDPPADTSLPSRPGLTRKPSGSKVNRSDGSDGSHSAHGSNGLNHSSIGSQQQSSETFELQNGALQSAVNALTGPDFSASSAHGRPDPSGSSIAVEPAVHFASADGLANTAVGGNGTGQAANSAQGGYSGAFAFLNDFNLNGSDFGSNSANLEYAVLSSMLQNAGYGNMTPQAQPNLQLDSTMQSLQPMHDGNGAGAAFDLTSGVYPSSNSGYGKDSSPSNLSQTAGKGSQPAESAYQPRPVTSSAGQQNSGGFNQINHHQHGQSHSSGSGGAGQPDQSRTSTSSSNTSTYGYPPAAFESHRQNSLSGAGPSGLNASGAARPNSGSFDLHGASDSSSGFQNLLLSSSHSDTQNQGQGNATTAHARRQTSQGEQYAQAMQQANDIQQQQQQHQQQQQQQRNSPAHSSFSSDPLAGLVSSHLTPPVSQTSPLGTSSLPSNPNISTFSHTSPKTFTSALDWNNSNPSGGLAAPAGNGGGRSRGPAVPLTYRRSPGSQAPPAPHPQQQSYSQQSRHPSQPQSQRSDSGLRSPHDPVTAAPTSSYAYDKAQMSDPYNQLMRPPLPRHPSQTAYGHQSQMDKTRSRPIISSTGVMQVEDVYKYVNKPYNYLEAYHALIRYLQNNFENKSDALRIIRALSVYRPSLIALQMPLTTEDEIFVERSFQRTLIELEKLIGFSGTPTVVWRRTGEIMLVGTEFTLLSEWRRDELLFRDADGAVQNAADSAGRRPATSRKPKRSYIFEIFDQKSCVEYYESFAAHAFESSSSTIMSTCSLVTPKGRKVPCTFAYTLKRDVFGLPSHVIGQFLPIFSDVTLYT